MKSRWEIRPNTKLVNIVAVREDGREWVLAAVMSADRHATRDKLIKKYGRDGQRLPWPDQQKKRASGGPRGDAAKYLKAYRLRHDEGLSYSKIAEALGMKWTQSARWAVQKGEELVAKQA